MANSERFMSSSISGRSPIVMWASCLRTSKLAWSLISAWMFPRFCGALLSDPSAIMTEMTSKLLSNSRRLRKVLAARIAKPLVIAPLAAGFRRKRISAMMRVKNEEAFLRASAESILPMVDEIVIIDNDSSDATPRVAADLALSFPAKVRVYDYPHEIAKVGSENQALAATHGRSQPLRGCWPTITTGVSQRCRMNFVLKWDGDMVATAMLR